MDGGEEEGVAEPPQEWDFVLPKVPMPEDLVGGGRDGGDYFSMQEVIGAIQGGMSFQKIHSYLGYYDTTMVTRRINEEIQGVPSMFFVVASNNEMLLRLCVGYGGDVNATYGPRKIPLIGFAVINSDIIQNDTTLIVATLLSLGAKCTTIPKAFYSPFCTDLPIEGPDEADLHDIQDKNKQWCTSFVRSWLAKSLNLSQRYYLEKALHTKKASLRQKQVALRRNAEGLLGIHYFLIGQTMAARWLMQKLLSYMILPSKRPLVLVFAGPSGHGKTELARQLGHLLSLELEVVDCTIYNREMELFGGRAPFVGSERGTPLNNFLARKAGQKCVVFLDEFEKTTDDIHNALLIPFDKGEYQDRRNNGIVDCSKTLWILATNALDGTIMDFCRQHEKAIFVDDNMDNLGKLMKMLEKDLKTGFKGETSAPLTGRISSFVPFLPFTSGEQCVVAHKYILELAHRIRAPVSLSPGPDERLLGNVYLKVRRDATVCKALAEEGYDRDLGARSLINAVKTEVEIAVVESYLEVDREIEEGQGTEEFLADYRNGTVEVKRVGRADDGEDEESRDSEDDE
ncbi:P-loop containing nucleoside triphosphate hydrolase protein [Amniculicola lignicola CBS 123094]|uniref:P-loop containing nucleoside triphosphate hydrolase protein n=1 Tax=Amniculicola lignicola CBS 123094 TaxID=1392246 RepID=A0A6A5WG12_9PLEO|nr:P-loop containing nucleoside triphosphate hydrolase protein [Amniculicola lignicola CBS 123094]